LPYLFLAVRLLAKCLSNYYVDNNTL
jgi:hypothetical protein